MATEKLQIVLDAVYRGKSAIREAQSDLSSLNRRAGGIRETLGDLGGAGAEFGKKLAVGAGVAGVAIGALAVGAQQAFRVIGEGAELTKARDQFDRLAVSINSTGDAMLGRLKEATSGLMSDAELVANAGQIMSLGLQDTEEGVVRLAAVAGELGWDMSQVILTMANDSTMRLDALGLSIEDVTDKAAKLKEAGMDASSAFDLAVIQAGEEKVALVGKAADTTAGKVKILETMWINATDAFKEEFASAAVSQLSDVTVAAYQAGDGFKYAAEWWANLTGATVGGALGFIDNEAAIAKAVSMGFPKPPALTFSTEKDAQILAEVYAFLSGYDATGADKNLTQNRSPGQKPLKLPTTPMFDYNAANSTNTYTDQAVERAAESKRQAAMAARTTAASLAEVDRLLEGNESWRTLGEGVNTATSALVEQEDVLTGGGGGRGGGGLIGALQDTIEAMSMLSAESGDLFSRLRGAKDFNLAEELFSLGDKMGAGALDLAQFGVTAGLFDQARADELLNQSYMLTNAEQMLNAGMTLSEVYGALQGQQGNMTELATNFFSTIDQTSAEATLLLETQPGYDELDAFVSAVETANPVMTVTANFPSIPGGPAPEPRAIGGPVYGGEPYIVGERGPELFVPSGNGRIIPNGQGGGGHTFNFYNRESTALAMTSLGLARRAGLDRRMGVA